MGLGGGGADLVVWWVIFPYRAWSEWAIDPDPTARRQLVPNKLDNFLRKLGTREVKLHRIYGFIGWNFRGLLGRVGGPVGDLFFFKVRCFEAKRGAKSSAQVVFKIVWWPSSRNQVDGVFGGKKSDVFSWMMISFFGDRPLGETSASSQALKNFWNEISVVFKAPPKLKLKEIAPELESNELWTSKNFQCKEIIDIYHLTSLIL